MHHAIRHFERYFERRGGLFVFGDDIIVVAVVALSVALSLFVVNWVGRRAARAILKRRAARGPEREQRTKTFIGVVKGVLVAAVVFVGVLVILNWFDVDLAPILASAGVIGVVAGFAAQSLIKDYLAGFFILLEDQFAVGDVVEVGGFSGVVEEMTLRMTLLRDMNGAAHIVPNGQMGIVTNYTRSWSRLDWKVAVGYDEDADRVIAVLLDECRKLAADPLWGPRLDGDPQVLGVDSFDAAAVTIRLLIKTKPGDQWELGREFRRRVKLRFDAEGIAMPYPYRVAFADETPVRRRPRKG